MRIWPKNCTARADALARQKRGENYGNEKEAIQDAAFAVLLTWIIPAGSYTRFENEAGIKVIDPNDFNYIDKTPVNPLEIPLYIVKAFIKRIDLMLVIMFAGGAFHILTKTGALHAVVAKMAKIFSTRVYLFLPILTLVFGLICTTQGVNLFIAFAPIMVMMAFAMGLDSITGASIILLGGAIGFSTGPLNINTTIVAQKIAGLPLLLLCLSYTVAWLFAENPAVALWGLQGRYNGLIMLLACTVLYFAVQLTGGGIPAAWFGRLLAGAGCAVTLLCGMNFFMVDPLDAYYSFLPESGELFLGTVGNINFYGAFLDLCLPIAVWELFVTPDSDSARLWGAASVCLGAGLVVAGSDAAWLGAVSAVAVLCMARRITAGRLSRLAYAAAVWALCSGTMGLLARLLPARAEWRTVSKFVTQPMVALILAAVCFVAGGLLRRRPKVNSWRAVRVLAVAAVVLAAVLVLLANFTVVLPQPLTRLLFFDDQWGSNRGFAWKRLWTVWKDDLTPLQMLFGLGGDAANARLNIDDYSVKYMMLLNGDVFDSAHNEYLQHLICGGVVGLTSWLAFLGLHVRRGLRTAPGLAAAILGYAVQAFFSISMPGVLPLVFVLAALCVKPQPLAARGWYRSLLELVMAAPPILLLAAV